jgi:hypothetical protein
MSNCDNDHGEELEKSKNVGFGPYCGLHDVHWYFGFRGVELVAR